MESTFDVYLTGEVLPGFERGDAVSQLAKVFKLDLAVADQLVSGQKRRVKANCNKAAALQFRQILTAAGLQVAVQRHSEDGQAAQTTPAAALPELAERAVFDSQPSHNQAGLLEPVQADVSIPLDYEPVLTDATAKEARPKKVEIVGELKMAPVGELLIEPSPETPSAISELNFDLAPAGAPIPNLKRNIEALNPDIDHLQVLSKDED